MGYDLYNSSSPMGYVCEDDVGPDSLVTGPDVCRVLGAQICFLLARVGCKSWTRQELIQDAR